MFILSPSEIQTFVILEFMNLISSGTCSQLSQDNNPSC